MSYKETIAVIGATSEAGRMVVGRLMHTPYRLLLMDGAAEQLALFEQTLASIGTKAEIDTLQCCREASWEADLILLARAQSTIEETAQRIKEVATTKIVIYLGADPLAFKLLQQLLPYSKLVQLELIRNNDHQYTQFTERMEAGNKMKIGGGDKAVVDTVTQLFERAGFHVQHEG